MRARTKARKRALDILFESEAREADVTVGADGFSHTRPAEAGAEPRGFKLGGQV